jgi:hypothetical protein
MEKRSCRLRITIHWSGKRIRTQAAGIKKCKATLAAKKTNPSTQAAKAAKEKSSRVVAQASAAEEEEQEGDELGGGLPTTTTMTTPSKASPRSSAHANQGPRPLMELHELDKQ